MDFRKIETIFIIAFVFLNIYLFNSYNNRATLHDATAFSDPVNVVERMNQADITLPDFEQINYDVHAIQANNDDMLAEEATSLDDQAGSVSSDGSYYTSFLTTPIELEGNQEDGFTEADQLTIQNFINSDRVLFGSEYSYGEFDEEGSRFIYYQNINGIPIMDGTSQISLFTDSNGDIFSYHQLYAGNMIEQGDVQQTITDLEAVRILFQNNDIPTGSTVSKPILSYHRTLNLDDLSMYTPVWVVRVSNPSGKETLRVHALNESIIQESVDIPLTDDETDEAVENGETEQDDAQNNDDSALTD